MLTQVHGGDVLPGRTSALGYRPCPGLSRWGSISHHRRRRPDVGAGPRRDTIEYSVFFNRERPRRSAAGVSDDLSRPRHARACRWRARTTRRSRQGSSARGSRFRQPPCRPARDHDLRGSHGAELGCAHTGPGVRLLCAQQRRECNLSITRRRRETAPPWRRWLGRGVVCPRSAPANRLRQSKPPSRHARFIGRAPAAHKPSSRPGAEPAAAWCHLELLQRGCSPFLYCPETTIRSSRWPSQPRAERRRPLRRL